MGRVVYAHWKKTKRTFIRPMSILLPFLYSVLLFLYYMGSAVGGVYSSSVEYQAFFLFLTISVQFVLSIMIPLLVQEDREAGNYGNELRIGVSRSTLFISRYLLILLFMFAVEGLALGVFGALNVTFRSSILPFRSLFFFLFSSLFFLLPTTIVYLVLAFRYQLTGSLIAGVFFTLSGILLGTTDLGIGVWRSIPWVWPIRILYETIPSLLAGISSPYHLIKTDYFKTGISVFIFLLIVIPISLIWYNKWEGTVELEE